MDSCVFCSIISGQLPSHKVYEDDAVMAFLDIRPISRGHTLVVPREHVERYGDLPDTVACDLARCVKTLAMRIATGVGALGFNLGLNNGLAAGQVVPHVHWHIIPRYEGDGLTSWPNLSMSPDQLRETAEAIKKIL